MPAFRLATFYKVPTKSAEKDRNMKIDTKSPKTGRAVEFDVDLGENLQDAVDKFGDDVVYNLFIDAAVIKAQARARNLMNPGKDKDKDPGMEPDAVIAEMSAWTPSLSLRKAADPAVALNRLITAMSKLGPEEKAALAATLKEKAGITI